MTNSRLQVVPAKAAPIHGAMHRAVHRIRQQLDNTTEFEMMFKYSWAHARWYELVANIEYLIDVQGLQHQLGPFRLL